MTWLTIPEAAKRVDRTERTIRSWIAQGDVRIAFRRIREDDLIQVDRQKRAARSKGRPKRLGR